MINLITVVFWSVFAFVIFGIVCLTAYITNPKEWHQIVASIAFSGVVVAGFVAIFFLNWSITL